jgi:hypothetical protein
MDLHQWEKIPMKLRLLHPLICYLLFLRLLLFLIHLLSPMKMMKALSNQLPHLLQSYHLRVLNAKENQTLDMRSFNLSVEEALSEDHELAYESIVKEINQMIEKGCGIPFIRISHQVSER